jgi:tetratricopeptide (TPR) repeat protein
LDLLKEENKRRHIGARVRLEMLYRTQGKFQEAIRQAQSAVAIAEDLKNPNWLCRFRLILGNSYIKTGQLQDALREIDLALDHAGEEQIRDFKIWGLFLKAVVLSQMKSFDEAEKASELLKSVIEEGEIKKEIRLYYLISGLIELEKKNLMEALGLLQEALRLLPYQSTASYDQALYLYPFADALYANKDTERAQEEFEKITRLTLGRQDYGDLYAKSFYMLGKIYEERGDSAKSIEHYEKFLDLWKDADSGLPEVEDARKRLAGLKVQ